MWKLKFTNVHFWDADSGNEGTPGGGTTAGGGGGNTSGVGGSAGHNMGMGPGQSTVGMGADDASMMGGNDDGGWRAFVGSGFRGPGIGSLLGPDDLEVAANMARSTPGGWGPGIVSDMDAVDQSTATSIDSLSSRYTQNVPLSDEARTTAIQQAEEAVRMGTEKDKAVQQAVQGLLDTFTNKEEEDLEAVTPSSVRAHQRMNLNPVQEVQLQQAINSYQNRMSRQIESFRTNTARYNAPIESIPQDFGTPPHISTPEVSAVNPRDVRAALSDEALASHSPIEIAGLMEQGATLDQMQDAVDFGTSDVINSITGLLDPVSAPISMIGLLRGLPNASLSTKMALNAMVNPGKYALADKALSTALTTGTYLSAKKGMYSTAKTLSQLGAFPASGLISGFLAGIHTPHVTVPNVMDVPDAGFTTAQLESLGVSFHDGTPDDLVPDVGLEQRVTKSDPTTGAMPTRSRTQDGDGFDEDDDPIIKFLGGIIPTGVKGKKTLGKSLRYTAKTMSPKSLNPLWALSKIKLEL